MDAAIAPRLMFLALLKKLLDGFLVYLSAMYRSTASTKSIGIRYTAL